MSFQENVDFTRANPSTRLCCTEYDTPARVLTSFELPPACRVTGPEEDVLGLPKKYGDFDLATAIFVANQENVGHLHGDQRQSMERLGYPR